MINTTLREVLPSHSESKVCEEAGNIGLKYCKLTFFLGKEPNHVQIFLNASQITKIEKIKSIKFGKGLFPFHDIVLIESLFEEVFGC